MRVEIRFAAVILRSHAETCSLCSDARVEVSRGIGLGKPQIYGVLVRGSGEEKAEGDPGQLYVAPAARLLPLVS